VADADADANAGTGSAADTGRGGTARAGRRAIVVRLGCWCRFT
jgi:hypothetical protein